MQLVVLSGKGGTGKTTIAAALIQLAACRMAIDCDVDAANLHLLIGQEDLTNEEFRGSKLAITDTARCVGCNRCDEVCRFGAIHAGVVDDLYCEGCGACVYVCPEQAITLTEQVTGRVFLSQTATGLLSRAEMLPGADGSGKLVTKVRMQGLQSSPSSQETGVLEQRRAPLTILDGPPGIGCATIATLTGCQAALVVLEPSYSGKHDFLRLLKLLRRFGIKPYACINRFDLNQQVCQELVETCSAEDIPVIGKIPFDSLVMTAQRQLRSILTYADSPAAEAIRQLWGRLSKLTGVDEQ